METVKLSGRYVIKTPLDIPTYYDENDEPYQCRFLGSIVPLRLRRGLHSLDPFINTVEAYWGVLSHKGELYHLAFNKISDIVLVLTLNGKSVQQCRAVPV